MVVLEDGRNFSSKRSWPLPLLRVSCDFLIKHLEALEKKSHCSIEPSFPTMMLSGSLTRERHNLEKINRVAW